MYAKFGFVTTNIRKGYYVETREDAFVMIVSEARSTEYRLRLQGIRNELDEAVGPTLGVASPESERDG